MSPHSDSPCQQSTIERLVAPDLRVDNVPFYRYDSLCLSATKSFGFWAGLTTPTADPYDPSLGQRHAIAVFIDPGRSHNGLKRRLFTSLQQLTN
jgi:hypothetical protein